MADSVRVTYTLTYPMGSSPESYQGEANLDAQIQMERDFLEHEGDYLMAVLSLPEANLVLNTIERVTGD